MKAALFGSLGLVALTVLAAPSAKAQTMNQDQARSGSGEASRPTEPGDKRAGATRAGRGKRARRLDVTPYIEIDQIVDAQLSPGNDVLTYTQLAAGVDLGITGRNNALSASVRYERYIGWGRKARDGDAISGIVRGYTAVAPGLTLEAGALATQARVENGGSALFNGLVDDDTRTNIYSVYGGPSFKTRAGDIDLSANYRAGFTKVEQSDAFVAAPGRAAADLFDKSVTQMADVQAGIAPYVIAPVGLGVGGSLYQEDVSNLDQRVRDMQARAMVTVPVSRTVQVVGALGYEDVEVSSRDAVRDAGGNPVVGRDGRYVTDKSAPRRLSYDVSGLLWDVAVMWRPSRRTSLSAHVGRRYGSTSFGGTLAYAPDDRSQLSVGVYDSISGFGGQLGRALDQLPDDFVAVRDPVTGELRGCVISLEGNNCLSGALGSVRSAVYRGRGIAMSYSRRIGRRMEAGIGAGYDRRDFIAGRDTVLAAADGVIDENWWVSAYLSGQLGSDAGWSANVYANWLSSTDALTGNVEGYGGTLGYYRMLTRRLRASVALGINGTTRDDALYDDYWTASALVGLRYSF